MKERAAELKAEAEHADGAKAVKERIATMAPDDKELAEHIDAVVREEAPNLIPRTWYGMPAYKDADGKVVVFFQDAGKFKSRYCTLGFQDAAHLDDGDLWPASYAIIAWSDKVDQQVRALVRKAIS